MPGDLRGADYPLARACIPTVIEGADAATLAINIKTFLATLSESQRLRWYDVRVKPDGTYFATLLTVG